MVNKKTNLEIRKKFQNDLEIKSIWDKFIETISKTVNGDIETWADAKYSYKFINKQMMRMIKNPIENFNSLHFPDGFKCMCELYTIIKYVDSKRTY